MRKFILLSLMTLCCAALYAVPATPYPIQLTQPDGTTITVRLCGDESYHYYTRLDGTPLRRLESGFFVEDPSVLQPQSQVTIRRAAAQQQGSVGSFPLTGSPKSIVILVGFSDLPFAQTQSDFYDLLNKSGYSHNGATGSCRDYFIASSDSAFQPQFDVYGPYKLEHTMAYYGAPTSSDNDSKPYDMIAEACQLADADGVDFSQYDYNNDGVLDNVFVYYAGHNQAEGADENTIWPHQSNISWKNIKLDGKTVASYACTSEYRGASGTTRASIGTFCHEFGHVLGLPDFYDTNYINYTVGDWDVMSSGNYNNQGRTPPTYSCYERFYLGWLEPEQLLEPGQYSLEPLETSNKAYLVAASTHNLKGSQPNPTEFFMLEYRENVGWDEPSGALPGTGMLVWHIDYSSSAWAQNTPNNGTSLIRMHLEEANGVDWTQRTRYDDGRATDAYPSGGKYTQWIPKLHSGTQLTDQKVFDIQKNGTSTVSFIYKAMGDVSLEFSRTEVDLVTTVSDKKKIVDWNPADVTMTGSAITSDITLSVTGNFYIAAADDCPARSASAWTRSITVSPAADSTILQKIWISYVPSAQSCKVVSTALSAKGDGVSQTVSLTGQAPRPTYVTAPVVKPTSNITPYSFQVAWEMQDDAEEYYVTLYQIEEGATTVTQSFENFASYESIKNEGWESNTNLTTTSAKADGERSLYLKNTGDEVTSESYAAPVTALNFWISAFTSDVDTVGYIAVEAWNGTDWEKAVDDVCVLRTTKKKTLTFSFDDALSYTRFRLSYTSAGAGSNGVALDYFQATCSRKINYIKQGRQLAIAPAGDPDACICNITDLTPSTTYWYMVQCSDLDKGCEEHLTAFSTPVEATTKGGASADDERHLAFEIDSVSYDHVAHVVYVQNAAGGNTLEIFDTAGRRVHTIKVYTGISTYELPLDLFTPGKMYIVKYVEGDKMKRKQRWLKFFF